MPPLLFFHIFLPSLLFVIFDYTSALRCYQGVQYLNAPLNLTLMDCPMPNMLTCTKSVDLRSNLITRACSSGNCTINSADSNSQVSVVPICVNNTNTQSTFCCCYADGCNSAPIPAVNNYRVLFIYLFFVLICYNFILRI
ncbi:unnamed protein product [Meloidogyne enterolobii]|uniref:Uncharacterized protein n=1 Tax=Meloidogyne enterolobii TaxID=390850 RepID=A0ACB1B371_MELEN